MSIDSRIIRRLAELAHSAPSADNAQPWRFVWDGTFVSISYHLSRVEGKTFPAQSPATLLAIGSVLEILMSAATTWNLNPELEYAAELPDKSGLYAKIKFSPSGTLSATRDLTHPAEKRHTNRLAYLSRPMPGALVKSLSTQTQNSARLIVINNKDRISRIASLVKVASEIRFQTREVHQWLGRSLRFSSRSAAKGDGMDVTTLGLPPGGKLFLRLISSWQRMRFLNKFGVYKIVSAIDSAPVKSAPGLMAIISATSHQSAVDAGRLMTRSWININESGLAAHPYYVIADQLARMRDQTIPSPLLGSAQYLVNTSSELFELDQGETLHMLFRVGYSNRQAVRSKRLPLEKVYCEALT